MHVRTVRTAVEVVRISRRIVTETVQIPVELRHEEVVLTRHRIDDAGDAADSDVGSNHGATGNDREHVFLLRREVPEVALRIEEVERVAVKVITADSERLVSTDLAREQVDVATSALTSG